VEKNITVRLERADWMCLAPHLPDVVPVELIGPDRRFDYWINCDEVLYQRIVAAAKQFCPPHLTTHLASCRKSDRRLEG
jgi:hypothetical protein